MAGTTTKRMLLVGWDAADWGVIRPLMRAGRMPHLERLVDRGVSGALLSGESFDATVAWTTLLTGARPFQHGVLGAYEPHALSPGFVRESASSSRKRKAIWNLLSDTGRRSIQIGFPATHPAEKINGASVSREFVRATVGREVGATSRSRGGVEPESLAGLLEEFRIGVRDLGPEMYVPFVPGAAGIDQSRDPRLMTVGMAVAEAATLHAMATACMESERWDFLAVNYSGIGQLSRAFMEFAPPKMARVSERDFELYRGVVDQMYQFHDQMLGRLLELSGEGTTVILASAHGYAVGGGRPKMSPQSTDDLEEWHRLEGVLVMAGPGVKSDEMVEGATTLDVVPTVLAIMGLPAGRDMEGRPLAEALVHSRVQPRVDSYEGGVTESPRSETSSAASEVEEAAIAHLLALGYSRPKPERLRKGAEAVEEQNRYNLARSLLEAGRAEDAIRVLEPLARHKPEKLVYAKVLFDAYTVAGRAEEMDQLIRGLWDRGYRGPLVQLGMGVVALAKRQPAEALEYFRGARFAGQSFPAMYVYVGRALLRMRNWAGAKEAFGNAVAADDRNEHGWAGLATACLGLGEDEAAAEHALRAVAAKPNLAEAHYHLAMAMQRMGQPERSAVALRRCLAIAPEFLPAYRRLADLCAGPLGDPAQAKELLRQANHLMLMLRTRRRQREQVSAPGGKTGMF